MTDKIEDKYIRILKRPDLLPMLYEEIHKGVVREDDTIHALTIINALRGVHQSCKQPISENVLVNSKSRSGKDYMIKQTYHVLISLPLFIHRRRISATTFTYWHANEPDWTWKGKQLHLEDIKTDILNCEVMTTMTSEFGGTSTVVKNQNAIELEINGKPLITASGHDLTPGEDIMNRFVTIELDESDNQTEAIKKYRALLREGKVDTRPNQDLITAYHECLSRPVLVKIPFASELTKLLPSSVPMRSVIDRLFDYISASTVIHKFQREKEDNYYLATWDDYFSARYAFLKTHDIGFIQLSDMDKNVIKYIQNNNGNIPKKELQDNGVATNWWLYQGGGLRRLTNFGIIVLSRDYDEQAHKETPRCNINVKCKMKPAVLPMFPEGIEVSDDVREYITYYHNTNHNTEPKSKQLTYSNSIMLLCTIMNNCKRYTEKDKLIIKNDHNTELSATFDENQPMNQYYFKYFGIMVQHDKDEGVKPLPEDQK